MKERSTGGMLYESKAPKLTGAFDLATPTAVEGSRVVGRTSRRDICSRLSKCPVDNENVFVGGT